MGYLLMVKSLCYKDLKTEKIETYIHSKDVMFEI